MVMRRRISDPEPDRHQVQERRLGEVRAPAAEVVADLEDELEPAGARLCGPDQRLVGAPVGVGRDLLDQFAFLRRLQFIEFERAPLRRVRRA